MAGEGSGGIRRARELSRSLVRDQGDWGGIMNAGEKSD